MSQQLNSRQRKLVYAGCILVLLIPIIWLGAPASEDVIPGNKSSATGGVLAQMRVQHDLGESTLGQIDPSSAAMNLVLLGLRGPAAGVLHLQALDYNEKKDFAKLKTTVESIIKLQPHYVKIWEFQGWNLAFNVSREWDRVDDRFYWVKEGVKFMMKGTERNQTATELFHNVGDFVGRKFGNSDEKKFFRVFFKEDPDRDRFNGGADPAINPYNPPLDNYLVATEWYRTANEKEDTYPVKTPVIFRQGPARSLFNFAEAQQDDGVFDESNRVAWDNAYNEWTNVYGNERFLGLNDVEYKLNCTEEELKALAEANGVTMETQRRVWDQNVQMVNFTFWQKLANCERDELTVRAHRAIYDGKQAYAAGQTSNVVNEEGVEQPSLAQQRLEEGMKLMAEMLDKYAELRDHDAYIEEAMLAVLYWQKVHQFNGKTVPAEHPLTELMQENAGRMSEIERLFAIENRGL